MTNRPLARRKALEGYLYISPSLGLRYFQTTPGDPGEPKEHLLMAAAVIASIPCVLLFFAAQRFFVRGIVMTGIKG